MSALKRVTPRVSDAPLKPGSCGSQETLKPRSRAEQRERDDRDSVGPAIRARTGGDDDAIENAVSKLLSKPAQVLSVIVGDRTCQLDLEGDDVSVRALDDQIDLLSTAGRPEVLERRLVMRCIRVQRLRGQAF